MATYITGQFKDNKQRTVNISITSPNGQAEYDLNDDNSPIKIAYESIEIEYEIDDMFAHIIKKRMSINLATKIYLGDIIFTPKAKDVSVLVTREGETLFQGYVEPYTYSQPYVYNWDEFTLNCLDELGVLEYKYLTEHENWYIIASQDEVVTFKQYLSLILPSNTYYDMSKTKNGASVFERVGVSMTPFLGDNPDDMMNNEEVLKEILQYLNLHIIQQGQNLYIFDWQTIKEGSSSKTFTNIFDNTTITLDLSKQIIDKEDYKDNTTNISMADVYNQISIKDDLDTLDTVLGDPLDNDKLVYYSNYKQLWCSEYKTYGDGTTSNNEFRNIIRQGYEHPNTIDCDWDGWNRTDWYFKLGKNPLWNIMYNGINVNEWVETDGNNNPKNLHRVLEAMRNYRFFPFIISAGKCENLLTKDNKNRLTTDGGVKGKINMNDYFVVSVNGNYDDSEDEYNRIQSAINKASGATSYTDGIGLLQYQGQTNYNLSPSSSKTTNYLVFKGTITLNPIRIKSGWYDLNGGMGQVWVSYMRGSADDITFQEQYQAISDHWFFFDVPVDDGDGRYAHQFYSCEIAGQSQEVSEPSKMMLYPITTESNIRDLAYNYSDHGDDTDQIDKLPIFECELKVGDKYLVETYSEENKQKPIYIWRDENHLPTVEGVVKKTFSIGIDPSINDYIVGKEYKLSNTVNGRISNEEGMAIPIKESDGLSGKISFRIIGVVNQQWNEITRRHPTLFRSTKYYDKWKNLWSHVSSIWMKNFEIAIISDNNGSDIPSNKQDLVYMSNVVKDVINKKDDIEFKIVTKPTTQELIDRGIDTNTATNNTIHVTNNKPLEYIYDVHQRISERPERLYIDQYFGVYSSSKCIVETSLDDSFNKMRISSFTDFGDVVPLSIKENLQLCKVEIKLQQY